MNSLAYDRCRVARNSCPLAMLLGLMLLCNPTRALAEETPPLATRLLKVEEERGCTVRQSEQGMPLQVACPGGIGGFRLVRVADKWPAVILLRLEIKGLEGFSVATDEVKVSAWLAHEAKVNHEPTKYMEVARRNDQGKWEPSKPAKADIVPLRRAKQYIEVKLPRSVLQPSVKELQIRWVDFYRQ